MWLYPNCVGLSFIVFRISVNNQIKSLKNKSSLEGKEDIEKLLSEYSEDSDTMLSDFIPEQKTVIVILGSLLLSEFLFHGT
jgi:hypothetical protein